jgi:hypothetical protein
MEYQITFWDGKLCGLFGESMSAWAGNAVFRLGPDSATHILVLKWVFGNGLQATRKDSPSPKVPTSNNS